MTRIGIEHFEANCDEIIARVEQGEIFLLTRDGAPLLRLEPVVVEGKISG